MELDVNELGSDQDMQQEHVEKINNLHSTGESIENDGMVPFIGMEFESKDTALSFYKNYAKTVGFGVAIKSSRRSKLSYQYIDVKYVCTKSGTKRKSDAIQPRPCLKVDCKAIFHIKLGQSGKWFVHNFIKDHNHELFPEHAHYFPCHRSIDIVQKQSINTLHAVGVKTSKIYAAMAKQRDGYENIGCLEKDIRNHLDKERRLALEVGDANAMLEYFIQMQEENPKFFYAIDLDEEQRLRNVFWVDAKGRDDYQDFGDVVSFDTTYITNKYKMPFAPFIGVNNYFQSTLLGCALLADESSTTFAWLMKTWVRAMGGKPPNAIITDQDKAMKAAIALVFPNARHRYCLWHILRKVPEKLGHVIRNHEDFMSFFNRCIYKSWTREKFEERWQEMIKRFELVEDEWLQTLYEEREHWVPVYMKDAFFGDMSTTQRSESINSFFDKYVGKKTSLKEFVEQYKVAVQDRKEAEKQADFNSWHKQPSLKTPSPFEKQMSMMYTHEVFKKFQIEILEISGCYPSKDGEDYGQITTFKVFDFEKREDFIVEWDASREEISCLCHLFEYNGFLCRHTMATLQGLGVFSIPSRYILRRWTKDIRNNNKSGVVEEVQCKKQRYDQLLQQANQLFEEGSLCHESYNFVSHALQETLEKCVNINRSLQIEVNEIQNVGKENICTNKLPMVPIFDPKVSKTKGAPRRIQSGVEKGQKRKVNKKSSKVRGKPEVQNQLETQNDIVRNLSQQRQDAQGKTTSNAQGFCNSYMTQDGTIDFVFDHTPSLYNAS